MALTVSEAVVLGERETLTETDGDGEASPDADGFSVVEGLPVADVETRFE